VNLFGRYLGNATYEGDAELGGYVPIGKLRDHLFYFGNFNPSVNNQYVAPAVGSGLSTLYNGQLQRTKTSYDYAGKLTFKINDRHTVESSVLVILAHQQCSLGDSERFGQNSKFQVGLWHAQLGGALRRNAHLDVAHRWSFHVELESFSEKPLADVTQILDETDANLQGTLTPRDFGFLEPYDSNTRSIAFDTSKTYRFLVSTPLVSVTTGSFQSTTTVHRFPVENLPSRPQMLPEVIPATGPPRTRRSRGR